jgi:hypothetical protein
MSQLGRVSLTTEIWGDTYEMDRVVAQRQIGILTQVFCCSFSKPCGLHPVKKNSLEPLNKRRIQDML